jgi:phosphoribosyl-ATP pyrophosphohydrolase
MGERTVNVVPGDIGNTLNNLAQVIHERKDASVDSSYTAKLLKGPADSLLKKIPEEATEVVLAYKDNDHDHLRYEAADLVYHLMVVMERGGIGLDELAGELNARQGLKPEEKHFDVAPPAPAEHGDVTPAPATHAAAADAKGTPLPIARIITLVICLVCVGVAIGYFLQYYGII